MAGYCRENKLSIFLQPLNKEHKELLFKWRNDPFIVERSTSKRTVSYLEHSAWLDHLLNNSNILAFIIIIDDESAGHIRFEFNGEYLVITIDLLSENTGSGYGSEAILLGCEAANNKWPRTPIMAYVREENKAAQSSFIKAKFNFTSSACPEAHVALVLKIEDEEIETAKRYAELYQSHGLDYRSLDWGSKNGQELRFQILSEIEDLNNKKILDVGCGLGDFLGWTRKNDINIEYTGIDLTDAFINEAIAQYPDDRFIRASILDKTSLKNQKFDYVFASGIFATYQKGGMFNMKDCLDRMWSLCSKGIAFNSLSSWAVSRDEDEFYADPLLVIEIVKEFSSKIIFRHDYHPRDFTVYVLRES
jgi:SAM-dependent methyltransferase/RimJ/RimL family protein N-acetyltransferase